MTIVAQLSSSDKSAHAEKDVQACRQALREEIRARIRPVVEAAFKNALDSEVLPHKHDERKVDFVINLELRRSEGVFVY